MERRDKKWERGIKLEIGKEGGRKGRRDGGRENMKLEMDDKMIKKRRGDGSKG